MTNQMKYTEQYFHMVTVIIMLYKVVLTCKSEGENMTSEHSNERN